MKKVLVLSALLLASLSATAADEPPPGWHGSFGAGLSLSSGNSDAKSYNLSGELKYDPKTKNVVKLGVLFLRSESDGATTADKLVATVRDEYSMTDRLFLYGEVGYLRDKVALLSYLISPIAGAGYKVVKTDAMTLDVTAGVGGAFEKLEAHDATSSGAFKAGEAFAWKVSPTVTLAQSASGLWKANDTGDAFYHFDVSLATSLSKLLELKLAWLLDHKTRPAFADLEKTDTSFLATVVAKF